MTRLYFKPPACSVRNPKISRKQSSMKKQQSDHDAPLNMLPSNWRTQLDPEAIEQIADGLEKMVLSWTHPSVPDSGANPMTKLNRNEDLSAVLAERSRAANPNFSSAIEYNSSPSNVNPNTGHNHGSDSNSDPDPGHNHGSNSKSDPDPGHGPDCNPNSDPDPDPNPNPIRNPDPDPNPITKLNSSPIPDLNPNPEHNPDSISNQNTNPNSNQNPNLYHTCTHHNTKKEANEIPSPTLDHNHNHNPNIIPNPNSNHEHENDCNQDRNHDSNGIHGHNPNHKPSPNPNDEYIQNHNPHPVLIKSGQPSGAALNVVPTSSTNIKGPMSSMAPAVEEMMRGELIKSCRPSIANAHASVADQQSAEASFWYLSPAKSLPYCVGNAEECQLIPEPSFRHGCPFAPLQLTGNNLDMIDPHHHHHHHHHPHITSCSMQGNASNHSLPNNGHEQPHHGGHPHFKGPRIRNIEEGEDDEEEIRLGNDTSGNLQGVKQENPILSGKVSYHIKTAGTSHWSETIAINGENHIHEMLERKLTSAQGSYHPSPYPQVLQGKEENNGFYKKKVEELQIALLECAMEYEVKIVEMKMQMLHMKSGQRQRDGDGNLHMKTGCEKSAMEKISSQDINQLFRENGHQVRTDGQRVEFLRKQLCKQQREKRALVRELNELRKRERQFDLQRRGLDDALGRVNTLQRELAKREQEIVDCQLREKEVRAQLYEVQVALHRVQAAQIEPRKLLSLLPALREWLHTVKKLPNGYTIIEPHEKSTPRAPAHVDNIVCTVTKEIQALQKALSKLATKK